MGGPGQSDNVFLVLSLFYSQLSISKKPFIFQGSRGGSTFSRGSNFFRGGGGGGGGGGPIAYSLLKLIKLVIFQGGGSYTALVWVSENEAKVLDV